MYYQIGEKYVIAAIGNKSTHYPGKEYTGKECTLIHFDQSPSNFFACVDIDGRKLICLDIVLLKAPKRLREKEKD